MLFLTYWEVNEGISLEEQLQAAQKLMDSGLYPPEGVNVIRWDATPDGWGISIGEAENAADVSRALNMWRAAATGIFKCTKTAPAIPAQEDMAITGDLLEALASGTSGGLVLGRSKSLSCWNIAFSRAVSPESAAAFSTTRPAKYLLCSLSRGLLKTPSHASTCLGVAA